MKARYQGRCSKCETTIWPSDEIAYAGPGRYKHRCCDAKVRSWGHERDVWEYVTGVGVVCRQTGEVMR